MNEELKFKKFPSIKRLKRSCVITEKLDGTNAQINFDEEGNILCGSRNRIITPSDDNFGFAAWSNGHKKKLFQILGSGRHYGEWWGQGIQRRYNKEIKIFSLFNSGRWGVKDLEGLEQLSVVPVLYAGIFSTETVDNIMEEFQSNSVASPGFDNPEGIIVYHTQINQMFKVTYEHDKTGKLE